MRIAFAGSTGFLGRALVPRLEGAGHEVVRMVRPGTPRTGIPWDPVRGTIDTAALDGVDAIINFAAHEVGKRWTKKEKAKLWHSRVDGSALLAGAIAGLARKPRVLINASAVGYYGDRGTQILDEDSGPGSGFLADLCRAWEAAVAPAADAGVRTVSIRTGIVLGLGGPLFKRLLPAFKLFVGGRLGDGTQYQSWIALEDHARAVAHLLDSGVAGAVNLTAPAPVTNAELVRAIGRRLHRPSFMVVPRFAMRLVLGRELADDLLGSQRALPKRLEASGFGFAHPELEGALASIL